MGYGQVTDLESKAAGVGSIFFPIGCGATYDLLKMTVQGAEEGAYMDPTTEYIRQLNPESTVTIHRYTYVSKEWIIDNIADEDTWGEYADAIGWWNWDGDAYSIEDLVNEKDYEHKVKETTLPITMGEAFLGNFDRNGIRFISNGEVLNGTSEFRDGGNKAPLFMNYLPLTIDLNDITVWGDEEGDYMDPTTEYLRRLNPESTVTTHRYTYVSKAWIIDNIADEDTWEEYADAIGWWDWDGDAYSIEDLVNEKDYEHKIKTAVPLAPGTHFIGNFDRNNVRIRFPNALNMPTK